MTSIGGHQPAQLLGTQPPTPRLAVGQKVQVSVLALSRRGVSVAMGQSTFQLEVPSRFADAKTLTLEGTGSSQGSGQRVLLVATDDRPLPKPIETVLTAKPKRALPTAGAVVQQSQLRVIAQPISPDGKAVGSGLTLQLQTPPRDTAVRPTAGQPAEINPLQTNLPTSRPAAEGVLGTSTQRPTSTPAAADGPAKSLPPQTPQPGAPATGVVDPSGARAQGAKPLPVPDGLPMKNSSAPMSPSKSIVSGSPQSDLTKSAVAEGRLRNELPVQRQNAAALTFATDIELESNKGSDVSAASALRRAPGYESAIKAKALPQPLHPAELQVAPGQSRSMTVTVIGHDNAGKVILKAADQHFRVEPPIDLPQGTMLQATLVSAVSALAGSIHGSTPKESAAPLTKLIEILDDIDRAGRQSTEADLPRQTKQLPAPDRHLASRLLGLLAATSEQLFTDGPSRSSEQSGAIATQKDQIQALVRELGGKASESLADGWKGQTLPLGTDQAQAVSFYFRDHNLDPDDGASDSDADQAETQRAVFDVSFRRLGRCQIDVLCQNQRFDLLIRSERSLSPEDQQDIAALFNGACEIAGMRGEIGFKTGSFFEPARMAAAVKDVKT